MLNHENSIHIFLSFLHHDKITIAIFDERKANKIIKKLGEFLLIDYAFKLDSS